MPASLTEYIKMQSGASGEVWFVWVTDTGLPRTSVVQPEPIAQYEEKLLGVVPTFITLIATDGTPWQLVLSPTGLLMLAATVPGPFPSVYGGAGLQLRGERMNLWIFRATSPGLLQILGTEAPVQGQEYVSFCRFHDLAYRPDERIYYRAATHCPVDGARLRSWRDTVRDRDLGEDSSSQSDYTERW